MKNIMRRTEITTLMECKFRKNGFPAVLIMRLIYMPFDLVGYISGACNLRMRGFALGTFIGIFSGIVTFVFFGSAFPDPINLIVSGVTLIPSILLSILMKKKKFIKVTWI